MYLAPEVQIHSHTPSPSPAQSLWASQQAPPPILYIGPIEPAYQLLRKGSLSPECQMCSECSIPTQRHTELAIWMHHSRPWLASIFVMQPVTRWCWDTFWKSVSVPDISGLLPTMGMAGVVTLSTSALWPFTIPLSPPPSTMISLWSVSLMVLT